MADAKPGIFYRAEVIDDDDKSDEGKVKVWIPDLMPKVDKSEGVWAYPSNDIAGNVSSDSGEFFVGPCMIPRKGSYILVFFEGTSASMLRYIGGLSLKNIKVPGECRLGSNKRAKWVVFKSQEGRCIVVSDDPDDARVEITGKKRKLANAPGGDTDSVYNIDGNQTTVLLDERDGKEKLLIRTYKGDFINIDILNQKMNVSIKNGIDVEANSDIRFGTNGSFHITAGSIRFNSKNNFSIQSASGDVVIGAKSGSIFLKAAKDIFSNATANIYNKAVGKLINWANAITLHSESTVLAEAPSGMSTTVSFEAPAVNAGSLSATGAMNATNVSASSISSTGTIMAPTIAANSVSSGGYIVAIQNGPTPPVKGTTAVIAPLKTTPHVVAPSASIDSNPKDPADADKPDAEGERG